MYIYGLGTGERLICYVCGWAQGFKLAYRTPPDITNDVCLAEWLCMQFYVIHLPHGCCFNPQNLKLELFCLPAASRQFAAKPQGKLTQRRIKPNQLGQIVASI